MGDKPLFDPEKTRNYIKYSSFALQFFLLIVVAALIGQKLDAYFELEKPLLTVLLVVLFSGAYMYKLIRDLSK